jgi:FkbM family methyltransferase
MLIRPFFHAPARHLYKLVTDREYRVWCIQDARLGHVPRFRECRTKVHGWDISLPDSASFLSTYKEIFVNRIYEFRNVSPAPRILDLGANIGLSVLFFKLLYPEAKITAFEADPGIFRHLKNNVHGNGFDDVVLINKAIWSDNCTLRFHAEGADGGRVEQSVGKGLIEVEATDIRDLLKAQQFDFLKMDIEGAEETVLPACKGYLAGFKYIFLEYHSRRGQEQKLSAMLGLMTDEGFRYDIQSPLWSNRPFTRPARAAGFDLQLNIFAWKE